jgi:hypothetical protein
MQGTVLKNLIGDSTSLCTKYKPTNTITMQLQHLSASLQKLTQLQS